MWMCRMFINTHVFINSSVLYKLWVGGGGGEGGEGGGVLEHKLKSPHHPPASPPRLRSGTGPQDLVRNCNCAVWFFVY